MTKGAKKTTQRNALGRIVAVTTSGSAPTHTTYSYTPFGQLKTVTDAAGNQTTLTYLLAVSSG